MARGDFTESERERILTLSQRGCTAAEVAAGLQFKRTAAAVYTYCRKNGIPLRSAYSRAAPGARPPADVLAARDRRLADDDRTLAEQWLGDPRRGESALDEMRKATQPDGASGKV
jgi:hypothetical protein